jgi:hypothetical protein
LRDEDGRELKGWVEMETNQQDLVVTSRILVLVPTRANRDTWPRKIIPKQKESK